MSDTPNAPQSSPESAPQTTDDAMASVVKEVMPESNDEQPSVQAESSEDLKQEIQEAIENGASKEDVKNMIREFKLKVNGKEITKKIDLSDEAAIRRELQLAAAGQSAMQRSAELEKLYNQELERLKKDPWAVLKDLDMDPDQLAEERLAQRIEELKKSPEQIEKERIENELKAARARLKEIEDQRKAEIFERMQEQEASKLEEEIDKALSSYKTLPKSRKTVTRIADAMLWAMNNGFDDVQVSDVLPSVEDELKRELNEFLSEVPEDLFEAYVGQKNLERARKKRVSSMKVNSVNDVKPSAAAIKEQKDDDLKKPIKRVPIKDFFKNLK